MIDKIPCTIRTKIYGASYNDRQHVIADIEPGDDLYFYREWSNPHDYNAIAVYFNDFQVGYLNADLAYDISPLIDTEEYILTGHALEVTGGDNGRFLGCNIEVTVDRIDEKVLCTRKMRKTEIEYKRNVKSIIRTLVAALICFVLAVLVYFLSIGTAVVIFVLFFVFFINLVSRIASTSKLKKQIEAYKKQLKSM